MTDLKSSDKSELSELLSRHMKTSILAMQLALFSQRLMTTWILLVSEETM